MKFRSSMFKLKIRKKYPVTVPSGSHPLERRLVERGVLDILYRLRKNGYQSYLVGGCVRDILLGMTPKDFDIVTDAHPRQIKRLFARCFLIGKRFRLAHVYISTDRFIEVATFRAEAETFSSDGKTFQNNNVFGTIEEDALRRDFTVNALYYNSADSSIVDYTGGLEDIKKKILRSIGDPAVRFKEDPVRIIRAARFCARFGFRLSKNDYRETLANAGLISAANANRMLEELYKILKCGASADTLRNLSRFGVLKYWLPELDDKAIHSQLRTRLAAVDARRNAGEEIPAGVLLTALFYDLVQQPDRAETNVSPHELFMAAREKFQPIAARLHLPRKESDRVCNILSRKIYFTDGIEKRRNASFENRFIRNEHFSDSLMFYEILSEVEAGYSAKVIFWKKLASEAAASSGRSGSSEKREGRNSGGRNRKDSSPLKKESEKTGEDNTAVASAKGPYKKRRNRNRPDRRKKTTPDFNEEKTE